MFSTILTVSARDWRLIWIGIEFNTLVACYFLRKKNRRVVIKYFLIQALGSSLILLTTSIRNSILQELRLPIALIIKIGIWPAHLWYINLLQNINSDTKIFIIIIVWQKIIPVYLLSLCWGRETILILRILFALARILSPLILIKKNLPSKDIIILSSVNNNGWFIVSIILRDSTFTGYITLYYFPLKIIIEAIGKTKRKKSLIIKISWQSFLIVLNLSGFPPFTIFWAKLIILKKTVEILSNWIIPIFLLTIRCLIAYIYLWMSFIITHPGKKKNQNTFSEKNYRKKIIFSSIVGLCLVILLGFT